MTTTNRPGHWIATPPRNPMATRSTVADRARCAGDVTTLLDCAADDLAAGHKFAAALLWAIAAERAASLGMTVRQVLAAFACDEETPETAWGRIGGGAS